MRVARMPYLGIPRRQPGSGLRDSRIFVCPCVASSGALAPALSGLETPAAPPGGSLQNAFVNLDPRRKRIVIGLDCVAEQPSECGGFRRLSTL